MFGVTFDEVNNFDELYAYRVHTARAEKGGNTVRSKIS